MNKFIVFLITFIFLGCSTSFKPQEKCGFMQDIYGKRVTAELPIKLYISKSVPEKYYNSIQLAINSWSIPIGRWAFEIVSYKDDSIKAAQDGKSMMYIYYDHWNYNASFSGSASRYWRNNKIVETDIVLNEYFYDFSLDPKDLEIDFESLILHELGHALGLDHTAKTVMDSYLDLGQIRRDLTQIDISNIRCGYGYINNRQRDIGDK